MTMTRQRKWALKQVAKGLCKDCGRPAVTKNHCEPHRQLHNQRNTGWRAGRRKSA